MKRSALSSLSLATLRLPSSAANPVPWLRAFLKVEELEGRTLPAPYVYDPTFADGYAVVSENGSAASSISFVGCTSFGVAETGCVTTPPYTASFGVGNGTLAVNATAAAALGITVANNGTASLSLTGGISALNTFLFDSGFTFTPTSYYSGTDVITLTLTDNAAQSDTGQITVFVSPVADPPTLTVTQAIQYGIFYSNGTSTSFFVPANVTFNPNDTDGSEQYAYLDVEIPGNGAEDPEGTGGAMFFTPAPGLSLYYNEEIGRYVLRIDASYGQTLSFNSQLPLSPSQFTFPLTAVVTDSAVDPNGNIVTDTAEATGEFRIVFLPEVTFETPTTFDENQGASTGFVVDAILDDPTSPSSFGYSLTLTGTNGVFSAAEPLFSYYDLTITGDGTSTLTISGTEEDIQRYLDDERVRFVPTTYYSGNVLLTAELTAEPPVSFRTMGIDEDGNRTGVYTTTVPVQPVASDVTLYVGYGYDYVVPSGPAYFNYSYNYLTSWPDTDGSESATFYYTLSGVNDPTQFQLMTTSGAALVYDSLTQSWSTNLSYTDWSELQNSLDSLVLVPPEGYLGCVTLNLYVTLTDSATFGEDDQAFDDNSYSGNVTVVFVEPASVSVPTVTGAEGQPLDLGGQFQVSDPQGQAYYYDVTFTVPTGTLLAAEGSETNGIWVTRHSDQSVTITGTLSDIQAYLAAAGSLVYVPPDGQFGGVVPVKVQLEVPQEGGCGVGFAPFDTGEYGSNLLFEGTAFLVLTPSATAVPPVIANAATPHNTPVALPIALQLPANPDPSETVQIFVRNMAAGASLNRGANLGNGVWLLTPADLAGLVFTPPPGGSGNYAMIVEVVVTDAGDPVPDFPPPPPPETPSFASFSTQEANAAPLADTAVPVVPPSVVVSSVVLVVTVGAAPVQPEPPTPTPTPTPTPDDPTVNLPPQTPLFGVIAAPLSFTTTLDVSTDSTTPTTTETSTPLSTDTAAAFGMIPGAVVESDRFVETPPDESALPALGSPSSSASAGSSSFAAGRERHPLQPIQALEHDSATALFEGSGDSIGLVDQLYRDAALPPAPTPGGATPSPDGPSSSAIPLAPLEAGGVSEAVATTTHPAADERIADDSRSDSSDAVERGVSLWSVGAALVPLLTGLLMTDGRRSSPSIHRWLQKLLFQPAPARK